MVIMADINPNMIVDNIIFIVTVLFTFCINRISGRRAR